MNVSINILSIPRKTPTDTKLPLITILVLRITILKKNHPQTPEDLYPILILSSIHTPSPSQSLSPVSPSIPSHPWILISLKNTSSLPPCDYHASLPVVLLAFFPSQIWPQFLEHFGHRTNISVQAVALNHSFSVMSITPDLQPISSFPSAWPQLINVESV